MVRRYWKMIGLVFSVWMLKRRNWQGWWTKKPSLTILSWEVVILLGIECRPIVKLNLWSRRTAHLIRKKCWVYRWYNWFLPICFYLEVLASCPLSLFVFFWSDSLFVCFFSSYFSFSKKRRRRSIIACIKKYIKKKRKEDVM